MISFTGTDGDWAQDSTREKHRFGVAVEAKQRLYETHDEHDESVSSSESWLDASDYPGALKKISQEPEDLYANMLAFLDREGVSGLFPVGDLHGGTKAAWFFLRFLGCEQKP